MDEETVRRVARIAHLNLTDEEIAKYTVDLEEILDYLQLLDEAPGSENFGFNPVEIADALRDDEPHMDIDPDKLLDGMKTYNDYVRGPKLQ